MLDREAILPLLMGLVVATVLHLTLVPGAAELGRSGWWGSKPDACRLNDFDSPLRRPPPRDELKLGTDDGAPLAVAWVPYDAYERIVAPKGKVEQPAVQQEVEPDPNADVNPRPTEPGPVPQPEAALPAVAAPPLPQIVAPPEAPVGDVQALPVAPEVPAEGERGEEPTQVTPQPQVAVTANPTAAPRAPRDADPVTLTDGPAEVRVGSVATVAGLEVRTVRPRWSLTTLYTAAPRNPTARITFNADGTVTEAVITRSTGYVDVDGPIIAAMYRWRATGERLKEIDGPFTLEMHLLLGEE